MLVLQGWEVVLLLEIVGSYVARLKFRNVPDKVSVTFSRYRRRWVLLLT